MSSAEDQASASPSGDDVQAHAMPKDPAGNSAGDDVQAHRFSGGITDDGTEDVEAQLGVSSTLTDADGAPAVEAKPTASLDPASIGLDG